MIPFMVLYFLLQAPLFVFAFPAETQSLVIHNNNTINIALIPTAYEMSMAGVHNADVQPLSLTIKCETTTGSPHVTGIQGAIDKLYNIPSDKLCAQMNRFGSHCTQMPVSGDAAIGLCGEYGESLRCWRLAEAAEKVIANCEWKGLAGGKAWWSWKLDVWTIVYKK